MRARDNPFAVQKVEAAVRFRPQGTSWEELLARLEALGYRAAIVGEEGRGKTTLLEDLTPRLETLGFEVHRATLSRQRPSLDRRRQAGLLAAAGPRTLLLLDGADELGPVAWRRLRRRSRTAGGLVIATHRPGRLPTLLECTTSPELLAEILRRLHPPALAPPFPSPEVLYARFGGNLRDALRHLYDLYAGRAGAGVV